MAANGRRYSTFGTRSVSSADPQTVLTLIGAATVRPFWYDIICGSNATPADNAILWQCQRLTANGSGGTAKTPGALDSADPASIATCSTNYTTSDPTYTSNTILFYLALNQRATHRWIADPNGTFITPATANNGIGLWATHASFTGAINAMVHFGE